MIPTAIALTNLRSYRQNMAVVAAAEKNMCTRVEQVEQRASELVLAVLMIVAVPVVVIVPGCGGGGWFCVTGCLARVVRMVIHLGGPRLGRFAFADCQGADHPGQHQADRHARYGKRQMGDQFGGHPGEHAVLGVVMAVL